MSFSQAIPTPRPEQEGLYTTVVVPHGVSRELRGFNYGFGNNVPGTSFVAGRRETNMWMRNQCQRDEGEWVGMELAIPIITPPEFRGNPADGPYRVTEQDVIEFARTSFVRLFLDMEEPVFTLAPDRAPMSWSVTGAVQRVPFPDILKPQMVQKIWMDVSFRTPPQFGHPTAALAVVFRMLRANQRTWVQYGKWNGLHDDKTKAYVVVGKEGLDALLAELLGVTPDGLKGEDP